MDNNWILLGIGWLGFVAHSLQKLDSLQKDAHVANIEFDWVKDYVVRDKFGIMLSFLCPVAWLTLGPELAAKYQKIEEFPRLVMFGIGVLGSYVFQLALGRSRALLRKAIDIKTNIADDVTDKPITTLNDVKKTNP